MATTCTFWALLQTSDYSQTCIDMLNSWILKKIKFSYIVHWTKKLRCCNFVVVIKAKLKQTRRGNTLEPFYWTPHFWMVGFQYRVWICYLKNEVLRFWFWLQKREVTIRGHPSMLMVAPKRLLSAPNSPLKFFAF